METIETAAAAFVAARLHALALKKARTACKCEEYDAPESENGRIYHDGKACCRFRPEDEPCVPCVERAKTDAQIPKATAAARRRFVALRDVVRAAKVFIPGEAEAIIRAMDAP